MAVLMFMALRWAFMRLPTPHTSPTSVLRSTQSRLNGSQMLTHPTRLSLQALGGVVGEFGQGFGVGDADAHGDAVAFVHGGA